MRFCVRHPRAVFPFKKLLASSVACLALALAAPLYASSDAAQALVERAREAAYADRHPDSIAAYRDAIALAVATTAFRKRLA